MIYIPNVYVRDTPVKGFIFDVDGTILNSMKPQYIFLKQTAEKFGGYFPWKFGPEFLSEYNKLYDKEGMIGLYHMIQVDFEKHGKEIWTDYNQFNRTHDIRPVTGVIKAIKEIHKRSRVTGKRKIGLRISLNTTKSWRDIEIPLTKAGLIGIVDSIVTKDDIYDVATNGLAKKLNIDFDDYSSLRKHFSEDTVKILEKPNAYSSFLTATRMDIHPLELFGAEDTKTGVQANTKIPFKNGEYYDVRTLACPWGFQPKEELKESGAFIIPEKPMEMVEILGDHGGLN